MSIYEQKLREIVHYLNPNASYIEIETAFLRGLVEELDKSREVPVGVSNQLTTEELSFWQSVKQSFRDNHGTP